jgi:hypothetical protein
MAGPAFGQPTYKITFSRPAVHIGYDVTQSTPLQHSDTFAVPASNGTATFAGDAFAFPGHVGVHNGLEMLWTSTLSGSSNYQTLANANATDFVITGPAGGSVAGTLHLRVRGAMSRGGGFDNNSSHGTRLVVEAAAKFGQILAQGDVWSTNFDTHGTGILAGITDPNLDFPFGLSGSYPVGTPFTTFLRLIATGYAYGNTLAPPNPGFALTDACSEFDGLFLEEVGGQVMTLPEGYTLNSASWGIVDNRFSSTVGVGPIPGQRPVQLSLSPNPSSGAVSVSFQQPRPGRVRVQVFDVGGKLVRRLADEWLDAGTRRFHWDGRIDTGEIAPAGIYLVRVDSDGRRLAKRVVRVR